MLALAGPAYGKVRDALRKLDPVWDELFPAERERIVKLLVQELGVNGDGLDIGVPMEFKVRGGRKEIVLPPEANTAPEFGPRRPIVVALARAVQVAGDARQRRGSLTR